MAMDICFVAEFECSQCNTKGTGTANIGLCSKGLEAYPKVLPIGWQVKHDSFYETDRLLCPQHRDD